MPQGLSVFGAKINTPSAVSFTAGTSVASTQVQGLSSRQPLFGSSGGTIAQDAIWQYDSTVGGIGIGSSSPQARFYAQPPVTGGNAFGWASTGGVHLGGINSSGHLGLGTTAPAAPLHSVPVSSGVGAIIQENLVVGSSSPFPAPAGASIKTIKLNDALLFGTTLGALGMVGGAYFDGSSGEYKRISTGGPAGIFYSDRRISYNIGATGVAGSTVTFLTFMDNQLLAGGIGLSFYGVAATTRAAAISTVVPAAVYTSDVGAQVNRITEAGRLLGLWA